MNLLRISKSTCSRFMFHALRFTFYVLLCTSSVSLANDYYPLNVGDIWLYDSKETGRATYTQVVVIRQIPIHGGLKSGILQVIKNFDTDAVREENWFTKDRKALHLHKAVVHEGKLLITVVYDAPVRLLKFPLNLGEIWEGKSTIEIKVEGEYLQYGQATMQVHGEYVYTGKVVGEEIVSDAFDMQNYTCRRVDIEAALTIKQILVDAVDRLNISFIRQSLPWREDDLIKSHSSRWLAPDVGEVKFKETTNQPRQPQVVITQSLKNFRPKE